MPDLAEVLKSALSLNVDDRAALADQLLASLDELDQEKAARLWAEEAWRRLEEYWAGCAVPVDAEEVARKAERLLQVTAIRYHPAAEDELLNEVGYLELRRQIAWLRFI